MKYLLACLIIVSAAVAPGAAEVVERRLLAMATDLDLRVEAGTRAAALAAAEDARKAVERVERQLSSWQPSSSVSLLNNAPPGHPVALPVSVAASLDAARECWQLTEGAFDPTASSGGTLAQLARADGAFLRLADVKLDTGGFAKGVALDAAGRALATLGARGSVSLGGQLLFHGPPPDGGWLVEIAHPEERTRSVLALRVAGGSVATSGTSERGAHIVDPATARPAEEIGSVTVLAQSGFWADCLATGIYVLGRESGLELATRRAGVEAVVIGLDLVATITPGLVGAVEPLHPEVRVRVHESSRQSAGGSGAPATPSVSNSSR